MDANRYDRIAKNAQDFIEVNISAYIPKPKDIDYKTGYISRYFVQKANDSDAVIYEVSTSTYNRLISNPMYISTNLDWRLTGPKEEVKKSNSISVRIASNNIQKIQLYLPNLLQFHQK